MAAVAAIAWRRARPRLASIAAHIVLVGVLGGLVLALIVGARRSGTALARFNSFSRSSDVTLIVGGAKLIGPAQVRAVSRLPGVVGVGEAAGELITIPKVPRLTPISVVQYLGTSVDRPRVISGRDANPAAPDEIAVGEQLAATLHVHVGGHVEAVSFDPAQAAGPIAVGGDPGPPRGPRLRFRVVGIVRRPLDLGDKSASGGALLLTPAFDRRYHGRVGIFGTLLRVRTADPAVDVPRVTAAARSMFRSAPFFDAEAVAAEAQGASNAIDVVTAALLIVAAVAAMAGTVALVITISRGVDEASLDQPTLAALGLVRSQRVMLSWAESPVVALGGALMSVVVAIGLSPLFPVGVARLADPDPGLHADWTVLSLGAMAVTIVVAVIGFLAALRTTSTARRTVATRRTRAPVRVGRPLPSRVPPTVATGWRMAVVPDAGDSALSMRSAIFGIVFGVVGVTAVLVYSSSLTVLAATPRWSGWNWAETRDDSGSTTCAGHTYGLEHASGITALAALCTQDLQIDGRPVAGWSFTEVRGDIQPAVVAGRAPSAPDEVALGSVTLSALQRRIGQTVSVATTSSHGRSGTVTYRIVGQVVLPLISDTQSLADGATFTSAGFATISDPRQVQRSLAFQFSPTVSRSTIDTRISKLAPELDSPEPRVTAVEIQRIDQIGWTGATLATLFAALATVALVHAVFTGVRRRRRELAVLKVLGFDRRQLRVTVAWQASVLAAIGGIVGVPVGIVVGNLVWRRVAEGVGTASVRSVPVALLAVLVPVLFAAAVLIAYVPGRRAAALSAAGALRSE